MANTHYALDRYETLLELAAIKAKTDNLPASPADEAGLIVDIKAKTDNLPSDPADQSELEGEIQKAVTWLDFWSDLDNVIDLGPSEPTDVNLPNVVVSGLPSGISLVRVVTILKVRAIENTSATGANAIDGAQAIRVKLSTHTWGTHDLAAINLPDNLWTVAASTRESGDVLVGDNDVKSEVSVNGTYNFRFEDQVVDYDQLRLNDVMVGLRFYFTTG